MNPALDDPAFWVGDPDAALAALRRDDPVWWYGAGRFWAVSRHADVLAVSRDPARFCNGKGVLMTDRERPVAAADSLLYLDPPQHARHRELVSRAFTPRRMAQLEPWMARLAGELIDAMEPGTTVDAVDGLAAPFPILVIAELLGIPASDREQFRVWSDAVAAAALGAIEEHAAAVLELMVYFQVELASRHMEPKDDLLSALVRAEVDGERLTEQELLGFCITLLVAGNETTRSAIAGGLAALAEHPDQRAALAADPSGVPTAVEEVLRWVTPVTTFSRTATTEVVVGDQKIAEGDYVVLLYRSANRDEAVFGDDALAFDARRERNPQLAFGFGEHFCMGAALARAELRVVLNELLARRPEFALAAPPERIPSTLFNQYARVPLAIG